MDSQNAGQQDIWMQEVQEQQMHGGKRVQQLDQLVSTEAAPVTSMDQKLQPVPVLEWVRAVRKCLIMRPIIASVLALLLVLHILFPSRFDGPTLILLGCAYIMALGSGGLEAARLTGATSDPRRQERLVDEALRRAGRLQSNLEPCTATDDVVHHILASGGDPRSMVIMAGTEVEEAVRAVYRHYSETERMAGTSNGTDLPLSFMVQELIWRGLLSPDIYDTVEPILSLRELAMTPRTRITAQTAHDTARAAQAVVLRVQSLGITIRPKKQPLTWMRADEEKPPVEKPAAVQLEASPPLSVESPIQEDLTVREIPAPDVDELPQQSAPKDSKDEVRSDKEKRYVPHTQHTHGGRKRPHRS